MEGRLFQDVYRGSQSIFDEFRFFTTTFSVPFDAVNTKCNFHVWKSNF